MSIGSVGIISAEPVSYMEIILNIKNFDKQKEIFQDPHRYKIISKGRRFGLTRGMANEYIMRALQSKFKKGLWVDTINANIDRYVERFMIPELRKLPKQIHWQWKKQARTLLIKDSYIDFRSSDNPQNIEGFGYDLAFLNEAGIILRDEYLWHNAIQPMLMEYQAETIIGGNPKGRGLFYDLYLKGLNPDNTDYKSFHVTTYDNPYLPKEEVDRMVMDMPERVAKQEIFGQFLEDEGSVFKNVKQVMVAMPEKPMHTKRYIMGVDLAKVQDYTVVVIYDAESHHQVYQARFKDLDWVAQKKRIFAINRYYNSCPVVLDATGVGDPIADDFLQEGIAVIPVKLTNESKREIIEKLVLWIEQERLAMLNLEETLIEFTAFTYDISSSGKIRYNAPPGLHDDIVIAHALAVKELFGTRKFTTKEPTRIQQAIRSKLRGQKDEEYDIIAV